MIKKGVVLIFVFISSYGYAQQKEARSFNLDEAISFAIDSNYTAINARRDIAIAIKQKWETTAAGLPQINGTISYNNNLKQPVTLLPAEITGGPTGTFTPVTFGTKQNGSAVATLDQLIFDGSYLVGLKAAKTFLKYSENLLEKTNLEIRKGVINAYGSVILSKELVLIFEKNKVNLEKNLFETRKIFENGLAEEESVEQLEITLLQIDTQLNNVRRTYSIAKQMFNVSLGIDVSEVVVFEDSFDELTTQNIRLDLLDKALNIEENIDYKIALNYTQQRDLEMQLEKSKFLPSLNAFANYGTAANSNTFSFFNGEQIWYQSSIIGLSLKVPVYSSGMRRAKTQKAEIALEKAETDLELAIQNIMLELNTSKSNYQFAIDKYQNAKKNIALAERIENKNQTKFIEGLASSFDLRQAQTQLYTFQQEYFQSMLDVINAKSNLETVLNTPQLTNN